MTTDHILSAALTFALLAGGTAAIGTELLASRHRAPADTAVSASASASALAIVTLPSVTVTGRRPASTALAAETSVGQPQRVQ